MSLPTSNSLRAVRGETLLPTILDADSCRERTLRPRHTGHPASHPTAAMKMTAWRWKKYYLTQRPVIADGVCQAMTTILISHSAKTASEKDLRRSGIIPTTSKTLILHYRTVKRPLHIRESPPECVRGASRATRLSVIN